jgi:hypothetical protein
MVELKATLKLYASLGDYLPAGARNNKIAIDVAEQTSISSIIEQFNLPIKMVHLVLVDGVYIHPNERDKRVLLPGESLAIWPPVAGG